jgi:subtilase family serine protease
MSPHHSDTFDPGPSLERPSWILTADMTGPPRRVVHPRARNLALRRRWRRTRRLRVARRAGWLVFVAAVITLIQSGFGPATTSGASQPAPYTSQPKPSPGLITFYLALPAHASSLVNDALAEAMPNNAHYRHFSSVSTLSAQYGASNGTMQRVSGDIEKFGLSAAIDPSRLFARVSGTAEQWASALKAPLREEPATPKNPYETYSLPGDLPAGLPPSGTTWLFTDTTVYDPSMDLQPSTGLARANSAGAALGQAAAPWPNNTGTIGPVHCDQNAITAGEVYTPSQVQTAYGVTGLAAAAGPAAPSIDVIDLGGGWNPSDLQAAGACFGYGSVHVAQSQGDGVATPIKSTDPETSLDLQTTAAVAPKASIHLIQASDGPASLLDGFSRALGEPGGTPDVATLSYGGCGVADALTASTYVTITNEVLAMLAMSGTSTFIAAGDSGSTTCPGPGLVPTLSFPAVSPVVTAVGGTRLTLNAQNQRASEVVWNDSQYGEAAAGGGGLALDTPRPAYQEGFNSSSERAVPDVSALADIEPGWPVFVDGELEPVGGTSGSSPFVAAATALVDAQQSTQHKPRIGLANGWFYRADRHDPASFYDVTLGDNQLKLVTCCSATTGYDQASGLGVPDWSVLPGQLPTPAK